MPIELKATSMADVAKVLVSINGWIIELDALRQIVAARDSEIQKLNQQVTKLEAAEGKASEPE